jgi:hypothetical protein
VVKLGPPGRCNVIESRPPLIFQDVCTNCGIKTKLSEKGERFNLLTLVSLQK